ncbi:MAG TPA: nucleotide disphospho-sugar-binding domain-containing protein [Noviherbaspirillum sp.]|nr:nucleotide disphospho-sugar-binding domain-containing protein [Noviherbaspirillum sp.]
MNRSGRRVLLAWEMGEGLGHAARLLAMAERLRDHGWSPVVAARAPAALAERYAAAGVAVIAAPAHRSCFAGPGRFRAATYADVMGVCGYADEQQLAAVVAAWDQVLMAQRPDVVIADYAPLLSLAAFGRVPVIGVGDGFVTPHGLPDGCFPSLGDVAPAVWDPAILLRTAQQVQAARGLPQPESLPHIIEGVGQVVTVPPELDIYGATRPVPAAGPWELPPPPLAPPTAPYVFSYLRLQHPLARMVLQVLKEIRMPGECYLHGATEQEVADLKQAGIRVHPQPPPLREALGRASFLIHHGGMGSMEEAALAGRPQLLLPRHLEQSLNTQRAIATLPGVFTLRAGAGIEQLRRRLLPLLQDARPMQAAQMSASRLTARPETAWEALQRLLTKLA